jgi:uroporphyrinogen III methyltransferase/synthase
VGETVRSPLARKRIVITRAAVQSEEFARELSALGAIPVVLPLVAFEEPDDFAPLDAAITQLEQFGWIVFTSGQAVRAVAARSERLGHPLSQAASKSRIAAVGPVSADAVRRAGLTVEYVAKNHNGVALANELGERLREQRVLLPRSDRANPELPAALKGHGAHVTEVIAYQNLIPSEVDKQDLGKIAAGEADAILFFSPSAVQHFGELLGIEKLCALQDRVAITAVGPVTANALREAKIERMVVAADTTAGAVLTALEEHFAQMAKHSTAGAKRG